MLLVNVTMQVQCRYQGMRFVGTGTGFPVLGLGNWKWKDKGKGTIGNGSRIGRGTIDEGGTWK